MPFESGREKTGGRKKGTPNKSTLAIRELLDEKRFSIPLKALQLFEKAEERNDHNFQLDILKFLAPYAHAKLRDSEGGEENQPEVSGHVRARAEELLKKLEEAQRPINNLRGET